MEKVYIEDQDFEKIDYTTTLLRKGEYENCHFINCNFSNTDLSSCDFSECRFTNCNVSMAKLVKAGLKDVHFKDCKLLGLHFDTCNDFLFTISFDNCVINLSTFEKRKLKKTVFKNSTLHEVDFTGADLTGSVFDNCDLTRAIFYNTLLEKVDFTTAYNYSIDPEVNRMKKAIFSALGISGLLDKYDIKIV
jgi:fluoroquinolone resistance protein